VSEVQGEGNIVYSDVCLRCKNEGNVVYSDVCVRYSVTEILCTMMCV